MGQGIGACVTGCGLCFLLLNSGFAQSVPTLIKAENQPVPVKQVDKESYQVLSTTRKKGLKNDWTINRVKQPAKKEKLHSAPVETASIPNPVVHEVPNMLFVTTGSSTSLLQWHFNGQQYSAWSSNDFSLLGGVVEFMKGESKHTTFIMVDTASQLERFDEEAPFEATDFQLIMGDPENTEALDIVKDLLTLCDTEFDYFTEKATQQETIEVEKKPKRDITVNFWKVEKEVAQ